MISMQARFVLLGQGFAHVFKVKTLAINDKYRLHFLARKEVGAKGVAVLHSES